MDIVVAALYKLGQENGKYTEKFKELQRKEVVITRKYAELNNGNTLSTGLLYVIDEKESEAFAKYLFEKRNRVEKLKELKEVANANVLGAVLAEVVETASKKNKKQ
jgi:hypothetical protein